MQLRVIRSFALLKIINLKTVGNPLYTAEPHTRTTYMNLKNLAKPYKKHFFHNSQQKGVVSERLVKKVAKIALCAGGIMWMTGVIHAPVKGPIHARNPVPESPQVATSSPGIRLYVHLDMNPNNTTSLSKPTSDDETTVAPLGIDPPKVMDPESSPSSIPWWKYYSGFLRLSPALLRFWPISGEITPSCGQWRPKWYKVLVLVQL